MSRLFPLALLLAALVTIAGCTQRRPIDVVRASGDQKFRVGDYAAARDEYAEIVSQYPGDWQAQYRMGLCMIETQQYSRARQALETAYTLRPSQEVADGFAKAMFMQKDESKLFAFLRERASTTRTTAAYLELGRYSMLMDDPDSAQVGFDTAIEVDMGKSTVPYIEAAKLEERLGHLDVAVSRLRQAYGINPFDTRVHEMLRRLGEDPFKLQPLPPGREIKGA
ncbi:MAG TPA: tetratricopeptide repeat protein [Phycisphaerales bacterium]|nr:tetratricopeptide repeat protein [Phycisphaerales bacterium]